MLPLLAVLFVLAVVWLDWKRSRLPVFDYLVLRVTLIYSRLWHRWKRNRPAPFPREGACLVVSNHTCSADPVFIVAGCRSPIGFVVAQEHFNLHPFTRWVLDGLGCVPVRRGGCDPIAVRRILRALEGGHSLCLFPEGNLSSVRRNRLGLPKTGIGYLALKTRLPVFPVYVEGGPRTDELLASWLLPSPRAARVRYGPAIDLSAFYARPLNRKLIEDATHLIMDRIRALGNARPGHVPDGGEA